MFKRVFSFSGLEQETAFFWGPRQTGKSTLLKSLFALSARYDLLLSGEYQRLLANPSVFREEVLNLQENKFPVIIDEVQKIPILLDEVQWLIVNHNIPFILCGSSARKLKRNAANLLGGRAIRYELFPLVFPEIPDFDLLRALEHGLLPKHYLSSNPIPLHRAYIGDYLKEEVSQEAISRNLHAFNGFLTSAAFSSGEIVNFTNIARDCGASLYTVKEYFQILTDTLIGKFIPSFQKKPKRRVIQSPKFYFYDLCIINTLLNRRKILFPSEVFGKAFEQFIFQELSAHSKYSGFFYDIFYWRTASQLEVDFILGDHNVAVEVKSTRHVDQDDMKGMKAFLEEYNVKQAIIVSLDPNTRKVGNIIIMPWMEFLQKLWSGQIYIE
ncbi:MAG: AAA family ATPase [Bacteroidetes bacterium RIFCSPLOWO2_12_FULL_37_12]|nr:MAG: AAA family ATPase [Bacteroidetes bacterium RIFCSPLOWO2_12_FULL_37_12]